MCLECHFIFACGHPDYIVIEYCPIYETVGDGSMCDLDTIFETWATIVCASCEDDDEED